MEAVKMRPPRHKCGPRVTVVILVAESEGVGREGPQGIPAAGPLPYRWENGSQKAGCVWGLDKAVPEAQAALRPRRAGLPWGTEGLTP